MADHPPPLIPKRWRGPFRRDRCSNSPPMLLLEGIRQFNRGEFFEQHETLEELWRAEPDDVRYLYQGILQVGVGFYHLGRGNYRGAVSRLQAGLDKLRWFTPTCQGVEVARLVEESTTQRPTKRAREIFVSLCVLSVLVVGRAHPVSATPCRWPSRETAGGTSRPR